MAKISPIIRSGTGDDLPIFLTRDPSLDCALNRLSRPLSKPDSKFSSQKQVGSKRSHLAMQEWLREHSGLENRLLSALIWNLGGHFKIIARFAGLFTFFR